VALKFTVLSRFYQQLGTLWVGGVVECRRGVNPELLTEVMRELESRDEQAKAALEDGPSVLSRWMEHYEIDLESPEDLMRPVIAALETDACKAAIAM
jgi:hypothetical protein